MNIPNVDKAWDILIARKVERKENRTAFIAALILDRVSYAAPRADESAMKIGPHTAMIFAVELTRLAVRIHGLAELDCNQGLNDRQEVERDRLRQRFADLAGALGFEARTGGDPRGACAYLIDPDNRQGDGFGEGWAVYR